MKKIRLTAMLLALALLVSLCAGAAAETSVRADAYAWYDAELCKYSNVLIVRLARGDAYVLVDAAGQVLPVELDDQVYANDVYFGSGYQMVSKDGKLCFASAADGIVFTSGISSAVSYRQNGAFGHVQDDAGNRIVITPLGQLPTHYADVASSSSSAARIMAVKTAEDAAGVIGLAGEEVVPMDGTYTSLYSLTVSNDGVLVLGDKGRNKDGLHDYVLYTVDYDPTGLSVAPVDDGTWICAVCQTANSGKFCSECGAKKPE